MDLTVFQEQQDTSHADPAHVRETTEAPRGLDPVEALAEDTADNEDELVVHEVRKQHRKAKHAKAKKHKHHGRDSEPHVETEDTEASNEIGNRHDQEATDVAPVAGTSDDPPADETAVVDVVEKSAHDEADADIDVKTLQQKDDPLSQHIVPDAIMGDEPTSETFLPVSTPEEPVPPLEEHAVIAAVVEEIAASAEVLTADIAESTRPEDDETEAEHVIEATSEPEPPAPAEAGVSTLVVEDAAHAAPDPTTDTDLDDFVIVPEAESDERAAKHAPSQDEGIDSNAELCPLNQCFQITTATVLMQNPAVVRLMQPSQPGPWPHVHTQPASWWRCGKISAGRCWTSLFPAAM